MAPDQAKTPRLRDDSHWEQMERRERTLWRYSILLLILLAAGLGIASWETVHSSTLRLEALPIGLLVLVVLFGFYVWRQRREIGDLRNFLRGMQEGAAAPVNEQQIEKLLDKVAHSQRGYRELIDSLDHIVFNLSLEGEIKVVNRRFREIIDRPFPEIISHRVEEFFSEPEREAALGALPRFLERRSWSGVLRIRLRRTGELRFYDTVLQPILKDGEVVGISGLARDVTAQRESESRFTELFESLQEGVYFTTPEGKLLEVNPALVRMLGYESRAQLLARNARDLYVMQSDRDQFLDELDRTGSIFKREITLRRLDGKAIKCLDSCSAIRDSLGKIVRVQGTLVDITERREMEQRLQTEQEFISRLMECFPDVIVSLDTEGKFTFVSPRSLEMLGLPAESLIGRPLGERTHPEDTGKLKQLFHSLISGESHSARYEFRVRHQDGSWHTVRSLGSPMADTEGKIIGIVASVRDVTEEKQFEQQLILTEKMAAMGQMLAGIAHELNNPLTAILGVSDLLTERAGDDTMRRQADLVHQQARRAADIVQSLLAFSRRSAPGRTPVKMSELIERSLQLHAAALRKGKIAVEFKPAPDLPVVEGDASLLLQVVLNLIINAEQAISTAKDHGRLMISAASAAGKVMLTVEDDGPGIPAEILGKVFDPFFTTKRPGGGTGLGLTISLAIIREHGGTMDVQSASGHGTTVRIVLPIAQSERAIVSGDTPALGHVLRGHSILVVDDEDGIRELVAEGLASRGMTVETVTNCEEALAILASHQFDVILCDYNLPGMSGKELFEHLYAHSGSAPARFIFMTGDLLDAQAMKDFARRGARAIQKPFQLAGLASVLADVLDVQPAKLA